MCSTPASSGGRPAVVAPNATCRLPRIGRHPFGARIRRQRGGGLRVQHVHVIAVALRRRRRTHRGRQQRRLRQPLQQVLPVGLRRAPGRFAARGQPGDVVTVAWRLASRSLAGVVAQHFGQQARTAPAVG
ncbi:conserved hypothetical protein [Ricinus communis]|uniref:Uncharacterized protein n=1 Tax=Ricinus communis TaxID=3988 RepID=B9TCD1_RICCO|nr:conserved hypothetical protein [Ricinus communis]